MADIKQEETVKIIPFRKDNTSRTFANYVRVVSTPFDVTLQFVDVKPPESDAEREEVKKKKVVKMPIEVEIILPIDVAQGFLSILNKQLEKIKKSK